MRTRNKVSNKVALRRFKAHNAFLVELNFNFYLKIQLFFFGNIWTSVTACTVHLQTQFFIQRFYCTVVGFAVSNHTVYHKKCLYHGFNYSVQSVFVQHSFMN